MGWSAGFGRATITPQVPVFLAGFGDRTQPADAVHDDLEVRALWLSDSATSGCLLSLDLLGMSADVADPVRRAVAHELGIDAGAVLTSCVHTHSGPNAMTGGERLGWISPDGYADVLVRGCTAAARAARGTARGARLAYVKASLPEGISINRRGYPHDPWLAALDVTDDAGARIGVVANLAIHPVSLGSPWLAVSSDWVGPFRDRLEQVAGGRALMLSGALGDVNPHERHADIPTHVAEAYAEATEIGSGAADAVATALASTEPVSGALSITSRRLKVPVEGDLVGLLDRTEDEVELIEWTIGDVVLVGVPGEPFQALGRAIDGARGGRTMIAGIAPSWHGYLPMPFADGYEESVSFGRTAVQEMTAALLEGSS